MNADRITPETRVPEFYYYNAPKRPEIRRLGTVLCDMVETTPVVFHGRLYRFEYFRSSELNEANPENVSHFRFIDVQTNRETAHFADNHQFGAAFADGEYMYVSGVADCGEGTVVRIFRSADLETWDEHGTLQIPEGMSGFNTGICKKDGIYTMLIEVNRVIIIRTHLESGSFSA